jgi:hypothetical protein
MSNQIFKFPGFFGRELDLTATEVSPSGTPAGIVGASEKGPAFIPTTIGSFSDFRTRFGDLNPDFAAPYAVDKFLESKNALTFLRVLGAGSNETSDDIDSTRTQGTVVNAGFRLNPDLSGEPEGGVKFLVARHVVSSGEAIGFPMFSNNNTYFTTGSSDEVYLVRAVVFENDGGESNVADTSNVPNTTNVATPDANGRFRFNWNDGAGNPRSVTASLDPSSDDYFSKVVNTDPTRFSQEGILVYADFSVDTSVATLGTGTGDLLFASGTLNTSTTSGNSSITFREMFGRFDTRYTTPGTSYFISQPYGETEYDLFRIESRDDGAYANDKYKISILGLEKSSNPRNDYGTFSLVVRSFNDTDTDPQILEQFNNLTLDPSSDQYIAKVIGDKRAFYNFDVESEDDRRIITEGKYPNRSKLIRVVMNPAIENNSNVVPKSALPFGFRGQPMLNTNSLLVDSTGSGDFSGIVRLGGDGVVDERLFGAIVPPVPLRFKVTRGSVSTDGGLIGAPGSTEVVDARYYWGTKFERTDNVLNSNVGNRQNNFVKNSTKFLGIEKLDAVVTGSARDAFNNNKFTLARVALGNGSIVDITSSVDVHMREAAYIRNGKPEPTNYTIEDSSVTRVTFATLFHKGSNSAVFNRFSQFAKFTTPMFGGFNGTNILDKNAATLNDRATSTEARGTVYGGANGSYTSPGLNVNVNGLGIRNNSIFAYRRAADIITDSISSNINLLAIPGQRDPLVTEYVADKVRDYGLALYVQDIPTYNGDNSRIFDGDTGQYIDVDNTADNFESRALDNYYAACYFPNVIIDDTVTNKKVTVPASVAAIAAVGFNDKVAFPWFAPAGFNRASLDFVSQTQTRIKQKQRERLFSVKINPIVKFPREGYVIFAQNTLQQEVSALQSINVQRMISEVKRQVIELGNRTIWNQITTQLQTGLVNDITNALSIIQIRQGIERFRVISDNTNNTDADREQNKMNVRVLVRPTRSVEFIAIDFILTNSGVSFQ